MNLQRLRPQERAQSAEIRVRGRVQGVGFRPAVWRIGRELGLSGEVLNDGDGVLIRVTGVEDRLRAFVERLRSDPPRLARVESIETQPIDQEFFGGFRILGAVAGTARTEIAPDAAICPACSAEILDPDERRYRYPFANCTQCGPRLSIVTRVPYERHATTMLGFGLCDACAAEYNEPADRRFHAEAIACPTCGPKVRLFGFAAGEAQHGVANELDHIAEAARLLLAGKIIAVKGLGGYQLACDATNAAAIRRLREAKHREAKPFALMARDLAVIRRYCTPDEAEIRQLTSSAAPIVLMRANGPERLPDCVAPGLRTVGFMLPTTPLHVLLLQQIDGPVVMTSANLSDEPQITDDAEALHRLTGVADYVLAHDRPIANRVDDSVVRLIGDAPRVLRRARGWAPAPIRLPASFATAPDVLAYGGELKATFCLLKAGHAVLSQHQGDLEDVRTFDDFRRSLHLYERLFDYAPAALAVDAHPEYLSSKLARDRARHESLPVVEVQHHHAHVAACLAENGRSLTAPPVLGIVLDGLGWGEDGTIWGGEFLLADYRKASRLGTFKPVAMLGGAKAAREPWRNLYAHLMAEMGWAEFAMNFYELELFRYLEAKPRTVLEAMTAGSVNAPLASSCGRLFDAVAAAVGICRDRQAYEGEAAARLESVVDERVLQCEGDDLAYPFGYPRLRGAGLPYIEPLAMWRALLGDLILGTPASTIAARFHKGLARALTAMAVKLAERQRGDSAKFDTIAVSGGCFQNAILFEETVRRLKGEGFTVLSHREIPPSDGGLALGQAVIAAARLIAPERV